MTLFLGGLGLLIYKPWMPAPFDITDFSEFLPLLENSSDAVDRFERVISYFRSHGRSNLLTSGLIVANWEIFGDSPFGWRMSRAGLMIALILVTVTFLQRLGVSTLGCLASCAFLVVSRPASEGWIRLTGEPIGSVALLLALSMAMGISTTRRPVLRGVGLLLLTVLMVLAKEVLIFAAPLVLAVALFWRAGRGFSLPSGAYRGQVLLTLTFVTVVGILLLIILTGVSGVGSEAYSERYAEDGVSLENFILPAVMIAFPLSEFRAPAALLIVAYSAVLAVGWLTIAGSNRAQKRHDYSAMLMLLALMACGTLAYLPWPRMELFYALPFMAGSVGLFALAIDRLGRKSPVRGGLVGFLTVGMFLLPGSQAYADASAITSLRRLNHEVARAVAGTAGDSLLVGGHWTYRPVEAWQGPAATLNRYVEVVWGQPPILQPVDVPCEVLLARDEAGNLGRAVFVSYHHVCGALTSARWSLQERYPIWDWMTWSFSTRTVGADVAHLGGA